MVYSGISGSSYSFRHTYTEYTLNQLYWYTQVYLVVVLRILRYTVYKLLYRVYIKPVILVYSGISGSSSPFLHTYTEYTLNQIYWYTPVYLVVVLRSYTPIQSIH